MRPNVRANLTKGQQMKHDNETAPPAPLGQVQRDVGRLVQRLRSAASAGYDEWRVQDPKDGSYCLAYSWPESLSPEREARAWLADQQARYPDSRYAGYVVACVRVVFEKDRLLVLAADALEAMAGGKQPNVGIEPPKVGSNDGLGVCPIDATDKDARCQNVCN